MSERKNAWIRFRADWVSQRKEVRAARERLQSAEQALETFVPDFSIDDPARFGSVVGAQLDGMRQELDVARAELSGVQEKYEKLYDTAFGITPHDLVVEAYGGGGDEDDDDES